MTLSGVVVLYKATDKVGGGLLSSIHDNQVGGTYGLARYPLLNKKKGFFISQASFTKNIAKIDIKRWIKDELINHP